MKNNELYYTPDIEDLHVGWEGEACFTSYGGLCIWNENGSITHIEPQDKESAKNWTKFFIIEQENLFTENNHRNLEIAIMLLKDNRLRCKYLDKSDIEELGWVDCTNKIYNSTWLVQHSNISRRYEIILETENHFLILQPNHMIDITVKDICKEMDKGTLSYNHNSGRCFHGECKSKNDLVCIMKKLKINMELTENNLQ